jgi:pyruvate dehydrogenase E2 component (dihydrolipoamide acetyltransferase)
MANTIIMPKLGFDMAEGTLIRWLKAEGDHVDQGEVLAEIETDKATVEVEASYSGVILRLAVDEGSVVPVGNPIAVVGEADEKVDLDALLGEAKVETITEPIVEQKQVEEQATVSTSSDGNGRPADSHPADGRAADGRIPGRAKASPLARRLANEHNIELNSLTGSGQGGRIVKRDIENFITSGHLEKKETPAATPSVTPALSDVSHDSVEVPLSKLRSLIGRRMTGAKQEIPHFYLTAEFNAAPLMDLRSEINQRLPDDEKLSVNDLIIKAAALALRQFPNINASLGEGHIRRHGEINIGLAVSVDEGLLTVVVRDVDRKPLRVISKEARQAIQRARDGRVRPEDVEGSTFTISNLGMFDIDSFVAIINPPEAAILAIGSVQNVPVVENNEIVPGQRFKATLSADHRVTDGAEAARWLQVFKATIEDPLQLLL